MVVIVPILLRAVATRGLCVIKFVHLRRHASDNRRTCDGVVVPEKSGFHAIPFPRVKHHVEEHVLAFALVPGFCKVCWCARKSTCVSFDDVDPVV